MKPRIEILTAAITALTLVGLLSLGACAGDSSGTSGDGEPSLDSVKKNYDDEAKRSIDESNAESEAERLKREIEADDRD